MIFFVKLQAEDGLEVVMSEDLAAWIADKNYCWYHNHDCYSSVATVKPVLAKLPLLFRSNNQILHVHFHLTRLQLQ